MKGYWRIASAAILVISAASPVYAQSEPSETVTVFAPFVVKKVQGPPAIGKRPAVSTVSVSRNISYHDIDLTSDAGETTLTARVHQAAQDVCRELERRFPKTLYIPVSEDKDCAKNAEAAAMIEVHAVVAASRNNM